MIFFLALLSCCVPRMCSAIRSGGQRKPVSVSEEFSHRRKQAPGEERPAETALHLQRGAALHRGMIHRSESVSRPIFGLWVLSGWLTSAPEHRCQAFHSRFVSLFFILVTFTSRTRTSQRSPSASERRVFTSTAGWGGESTTPSKRSWSLELDTICRSVKHAGCQQWSSQTTFGVLSQRQTALVIFTCCLFWPAFQFNPLLRDIFGLGPPPILDGVVKVKISRVERVAPFLFHPGTSTCTPQESDLWVCRYVFVASFFLPVVLIYPLVIDSIFSTRLPSRPGLNRGANSGTSGLMSCEKRTGMKWVEGQTGTPRAALRWIQMMPLTVGHTKTQQTPNSPVWLVPFTCNLTVFQHDRCLIY